MLMKRFAMIVLLLLAAAPGAFAGELKEIELTDGSVITGEVVSLSKGVYSIRSGSLGTITVNDSRVRSIRAKGSAAPSPSATQDAAVSSLTEQMMSDSEIMSMIESLRNDPEFLKALEDPDILKAIRSGDTATLMANPKFMKLLNNATVRDIERKLEK